MTKIYIIHGLGQTPTGTVSRLASLLNILGFETECPLLPHTDPRNSGLQSIDILDNLIGPGPAYIIGLGLGGFVAAKLQMGRPDLTVVAVSAPDVSGFDYLGEALGGRRIYLYSSAKDVVLRGQTSRWAGTSEVFDIPNLDHKEDTFVPIVAAAMVAAVQGADMHATLFGETPITT